MRGRLTFRDDASDLFWFIDVTGARQTVTEGERGTEGKTTTTSFPTAEAALADAREQLAGKLQEGYVDAVAADDRERARITAPLYTSPDGDPDEVRFALNPFDLALNLDHEPGLTVDAPGTPVDPAAETALTQQALHTLEEKRPAYRRPDIVTLTLIPRETLLTSVPTPERSAWWLNHLARRNAELQAENPESTARFLIGTQTMLQVAATGLRHIPDEVLADPLAVLALRPLLPLLAEPARQQLVDLATAPNPPAFVPPESVAVAGTILGIPEQQQGPARAELERRLAEADPEELRTIALLPLSLLEEVAEVRWATLVTLQARLHGLHDRLVLAVASGASGMKALLKGLRGRPADRAPLTRREVATIAALVSGPGAVGGFIDHLQDHAHAEARHWLQSHSRDVLRATLTPEQASALSSVVRTYPANLLREALQSGDLAARSPELARLLETVLQEKEITPLDPDTPWWADALSRTETAFSRTSGKQPKLPAWFDAAGLPLIDVGGHRLSEEQVTQIVRALQTGDQDHPLLVALRDNVSTHHLDGLAIALVDHWIEAGGVARDKWVMLNAGFLGSDGYALHLASLIRAWPFENHFQRAKHGLVALRNIGSDTALQQLAQISTRFRSAALKKQARALMEELAENRGLSREQLEDRVLPDGGLDERGTRRFDFGPRQFLAYLTPESKVMLRALDQDGRPTGKPRASLPKPNQKDDAEMAAAAKADYTLLKKNVTAVAKTQTTRFEQAMVDGRRWSPTEFADHIAPQPILRGLLAGMVWGLYDDERLVTTARLDEAQLVDRADAPVAATGHSIGLVHPVELTGPERAAWAEILADHELTQAFPQLARPVFGLPEDQSDQHLLQGLPGTPVPATTLVGAFGKHHWQAGDALDNGQRKLHLTTYESANLTVVAEHDPGTPAGLPPTEIDDQVITHVYVLDGLFRPGYFGWGMQDLKRSRKDVPLIPWSRVPAPIVSEVRSLLAAIHS